MTQNLDLKQEERLGESPTNYFQRYATRSILHFLSKEVIIFIN